MCAGGAGFSIVGYGCGYGALSAYLHETGNAFRYMGYDVSEPMIDQARSIHGDCDRCQFAASLADVTPADYAVASGVFNVKQDTPEGEWEAYVAASISDLDRLSTKGFAFNMLTAYSDADRMRSDLYYGSPGAYFDLCVRQYSRWAAVYHDYGLYEFTVVVRKVLAQ
mgnify:FL=1